jgi:transposase
LHDAAILDRDVAIQQAIGRSRGGPSTKIHALVDALGNPVELMLTPGQAHDLVCAEPLIENVEPDALLGDKAFDSDSFISTLNEGGKSPQLSRPRSTARSSGIAILRFIASATSLSVSSIKLSTFALSRRATTN